MDDIFGDELLAFDVAVDGSRFRMRFARPDGSAGALNLPSDCLQSLVMSLPKMMTEVLRARHRDESLRLVFPATMARIEQSADPSTVILTLATPDGFEVSFALNEALRRAISATPGQDIPKDIPKDARAARETEPRSAERRSVVFN